MRCGLCFEGALDRDDAAVWLEEFYGDECGGVGGVAQLERFGAGCAKAGKVEVVVGEEPAGGGGSRRESPCVAGEGVGAKDAGDDVAIVDQAH